MIICTVDTETTTVDDLAEVVEIGVVLYDTVNNRTINSFGRILPVKLWSEAAAKVHKIPIEYSNNASPLNCNIYEIMDVDKANFIVAHNASFDKPKIVSLWPDFNKKEWIDSVHDLPHDEYLDRDHGSKKLMHLAVEYGIPVFGGHRAVVDAELCAKIAARHDLNDALARKNATKYQLSVGGNYNEKYVEYVKSIKFSYDSKTKLWSKKWLEKSEFMQLLKVLSLDLPEWTITHSKMPKKEY